MAEQPSPPTLLPSSHCSPAWTTPSPHRPWPRGCTGGAAVAVLAVAVVALLAGVEDAVAAGALALELAGGGAAVAVVGVAVVALLDALAEHAVAAGRGRAVVDGSRRRRWRCRRRSCSPFWAGRRRRRRPLGLERAMAVQPSPSLAVAVVALPRRGARTLSPQPRWTSSAQVVGAAVAVAGVAVVALLAGGWTMPSPHRAWPSSGAVGGAAVAVLAVAVVALLAGLEDAVAAGALAFEVQVAVQPSPSTALPSSHCSSRIGRRRRRTGLGLEGAVGGAAVAVDGVAVVALLAGVDDAVAAGVLALEGAVGGAAVAVAGRCRRRTARRDRAGRRRRRRGSSSCGELAGVSRRRRRRFRRRTARLGSTTPSPHSASSPSVSWPRSPGC